MTEPRLVGLRALGLGDFCCAVPVWKALRRTFPDHRTVLAAPTWQQELVDLCPSIDELVPTGELQPLTAPLHGADLAVNLHGCGPESTRLLAATHLDRLLAFAHPEVAESAGGPAWDAEEHEVARWCRLVRSFGLEADESELDLARPPVAAPVPRATVLHPGAAAPSRRWPVARWAHVATALSRQGHHVVLTGGPSEASITAAIASRAALDPAADLAGRTTLSELAALIAEARLVVSGDTGTAHLASAYRTRSVVLFGPTSPSTWGPPLDGPHRALWAGQRGDPHAAEVDPGLLEITVEDVLNAVDEISLTVPVS